MIPYLAIMVWYGTMIPYLAIMVWYGTIILYLAIMAQCKKFACGGL